MTNMIVVTGASSGIGYAACESAIRGGAIAFGSVRKSADADKLSAALGPNFRPLVMDVTDEASITRAADEVRAALQGRTLMGLVNNAGIAVSGPILYLPTDEMRRQFEANLFGVHSVTRMFGPLLGAEPSLTGKPGRIVNITSLAGKIGTPFMSPYVASKHALEGYSASLRRELLIHGIDVIIIGPGAIQTEIWRKADEEGDGPYADTPYAPQVKRVRAFMQNMADRALPASAVGDLIWRVLTIAQPKTRYALLREPFEQWILPRFLPQRLVDNIIGRRVGLLPTKNNR